MLSSNDLATGGSRAAASKPQRPQTASMSSASTGNAGLWQHPYVDVFKHFKVAPNGDWRQNKKQGDVQEIFVITRIIHFYRRKKQEEKPSQSKAASLRTTLCRYPTRPASRRDWGSRAGTSTFSLSQVRAHLSVCILTMVSLSAVTMCGCRSRTCSSPSTSRMASWCRSHQTCASRGGASCASTWLRYSTGPASFQPATRQKALTRSSRPRSALISR